MLYIIISIIFKSFQLDAGLRQILVKQQVSKNALKVYRNCKKIGYISSGNLKEVRGKNLRWEKVLEYFAVRALV